jgi:hypothetical protein
MVFFAPLLPYDAQSMVNKATFTIIFITGALSLRKHYVKMFYLAILAVVTDWVSEYFGSSVLMISSDLINFSFFIIIVALFISQLVRSSRIGLSEIIESINGYLLLGIIFSIMIALLDRQIPGSLAFPEPPHGFGDYMYYGFITLSTLGYGDILPKMPIAKSLAILTTISGQFYIATIIAIIVSKYTPDRSKSDRDNKDRA